ncbi:ABC transporter ATP-binding protein [Microbacterium sp. RD1]|uniref:ABC transporter ATP-binding protein n=1 Tax=Microbacterium sp. RD1 TaxID=3457313 RepID=UPI003FA60CF3
MGTEPIVEAPPILVARGLSAGYGGRAVVRDLDIVIRPGEIVGLLGSNGAGKTTTILTLAGELSPLGGELLWAEQPARGGLASRARDGLGLVLEERTVFSKLTTAENLSIGRGTPERALEYFPELEPHLGRRAGLLSGGQQQMLSVGRALAAEPRVLLVDELSLGLAPIMVDRVFEAIVAAAGRGIGILVVEQHVRRILDAADRAYVLRRGRVVLEGPTAELEGQLDHIEELYLAQGRESSSE